jgi:pilus assembly protein CpaC
MTTKTYRDGAGYDRHAAWRTAARLTRTMASAFAAALAASIAVALLPHGLEHAHAQRMVQFASAKRTASVELAVGKSDDIRTDASFVDVLIGNPDIADVNPLTDRTLSILGKKIGTTRVSLYGENKSLVGVFDIEVSYDISKLSEEIALRFPLAKVRVSTANGRVLLSGTVPDGVALDNILSVAKQFGPDIINSMQVAQPQQVMLEVRFVEADRSAGRELGVQWNTFGKNAISNVGDGVPASQLPITNGIVGMQPGVTTPTAGGPNVGAQSLTISPFVSAGVLSAASPFGFIVGQLLSKGFQADVLVNALETKGLARSLAEPNLVALSGDTANFLAGGEYPIPVPGAFGQISVEYKRYGVSLAFTPTVLNRGLINLKIEPEVSQLDPSNSVAVGTGITVPALTVRRASSTIELRDGQSFVLAGLLQNSSTTAQQQLPWIGDVPVLGALFSSKSYQKSESDLIIIVTPRIVRPTRPGDTIKTPLDSTLPANDIDFFLFGKPEVARRENRRGEATYGRGEIGHMLDLPKGETHHASLN